MPKTTVQVDARTLAKLKKIRISKRESYDEVINRLIEASKEHKWEFRVKL
jgi:predicted CopG family antitoxin